MSNTEADILKLAYDAGAKDEYQRLTSPEGKAEFLKVCSAINKYTKPNSIIYDIGCGPGRYAELLLNKGYTVGCVDLSPTSLTLLHERLQATAKTQILFLKACCATELDWIPPDKADTLLLLGPMYHITNEEKRKTVIQHCYRLLKNKGYLIVMFMNLFPALNKEMASKNTIHEIEEFQDTMVTATSYMGFKIPQYRCLTASAIEEFKPWFSPIEITHIDNYFSEKGDELKRQYPQLQAYEDSEFSHQFFIVFRKEC